MANKVITATSGNEKRCAKCGMAYKKNRKYSATQWMNSAYCSPRCAALKRDTDNDREICKMYRDGISCKEIGEKYNTSDVHVARIIKENGENVNMYKIKKGGLHITSEGYFRFDDSKGNGFHSGRRLHVLIAESVIGRQLKTDEIVHHIDGDKLNNHPQNLLVMKKGDHTLLHHRESGRIKLTDMEVEEIRTKYKRGETKQVDIAKKYGVSKSLIGNILAGRARRRRNV